MEKGFENNVFKFCFQIFKTIATTVTQTNNEKNNECPSLIICRKGLTFKMITKSLSDLTETDVYLFPVRTASSLLFFVMN